MRKTQTFAQSLQQQKTPLSSAAGYVVMVVIPIIFIDKLNATIYEKNANLCSPKGAPCAGGWDCRA